MSPTRPQKPVPLKTMSFIPRWEEVYHTNYERYQKGNYDPLSKRSIQQNLRPSFATPTPLKQFKTTASRLHQALASNRTPLKDLGQILPDEFSNTPACFVVKIKEKLFKTFVKVNCDLIFKRATASNKEKLFSWSKRDPWVGIRTDGNTDICFRDLILPQLTLQVSSYPYGSQRTLFRQY